MIYYIFWWVCIITGYLCQRILFKRKTYYEDRRATRLYSGGRLIISNHYNILDYVMTHFIVFPRKLNVVASEMPFRSPIVRFGMKFFGAIQANRETKNMKFMDECAAVIKKGQLAMIFPEGRNTPDGEMHEFKKSYLVIAHRAGVPIVPIITDGRYGLFKRTHVIVGKEIDVSGFFSSDRPIPKREELERANEYVYARMCELRRELQRRTAKKKREKKQ